MQHGFWLALVIGCAGEVPSDLPHDTDLPPVCEDAAGAAPRSMRRLTATHVARALTDLTGVDADWAAGFPPESGGWEGLEGAQPVSSALVEALDATADRAVEASLAPRSPTLLLRGDELGWPGLSYDDALAGGEPWWQVDVDGSRVLPLAEGLPAGTYDVTVQAAWLLGWVFGGSPPEVSVVVNGQRLVARSVGSTPGTLARLSWRVALPADADVALYVTSLLEDLQAVGFAATRLDGPDAQAAAVVTCHVLGDVEDERACGESLLAAFAARAWRRPVVDDERAALGDLFMDTLDAGQGFEDAVGVGLKAVLLSPSFLFRVEDTAALAAGTTRAATPHELATRLAIALYGSIPDEALLACADAGLLRVGDPGPCGVDAQITRMLADPRSDAVVHDFARQWLGLDALGSVTRDAARYPAFDPAMRADMRDEVLALVEEVRSARLDPMTLIDAPFAFVAPSLAPLYGVEHALGGRVDLPASRPGLLGHVGVLALTSQPDRSSPVLRGKYVLDRLLCDPPDPPPDGIPALSQDAVDGSVAEVLAAHRRNPGCASCHDDIDPLGLSMEHFDAMGAWRDAYPDAAPVDASGALPDGTPVEGLAPLAAGLADDPAVRRCFARALATWALERPVGDGCLAERVAAEADLDAMRRVILDMDEVARVGAPSGGAVP